MNPFEEDIETKVNESTLIKIWLEVNGRKKNTYVEGWNITELDLKEHIKIIKKKNGCNGTLKEICNDSNKSDITKIIQLQGDLIDYMKNYLINNNIDSSIIKVLGQ
jgi:translation initiation factor 1 (eIF-1/SUI1)